MNRLRNSRFLEKLSRLRAVEALRGRDFRLLWYGQLFISMGTWMDEITRGWLIYELTNSALQLGLVRGIQAIPFLLLSPIAGSAADRYPRKVQVVAAQILNAAVFIVTALLIFTGRIRPWHVYATAVLMATSQIFQQPARAAMISDTVPSNCLTNAIGLSSMVFNVARSTGPALAGMLIAAFGTGVTYAVQAVFYVLATLMTFGIHLARRPSKGTLHGNAPEDSFLQNMVEGWKFSWSNGPVRAGLLTVMFVSLFIVPFTTLLPVFARDYLGVGAEGQGMLLAAMGVGALCSAVLIASAGDRLPRGILMMASVALYGIVLVVFAGSRWFALSLIMMGWTGLCHVHCNGLVQTVVQSYSPAEFRGRTLAIYNMSRVVVMAGGLIVGFLSSLLGARWAVASMGAAGTLTMVLMYIAAPRTRLIR